MKKDASTDILTFLSAPQELGNDEIWIPILTEHQAACHLFWCNFSLSKLPVVVCEVLFNVSLTRQPQKARLGKSFWDWWWYPVGGKLFMLFITESTGAFDAVDDSWIGRKPDMLLIIPELVNDVVDHSHDGKPYSPLMLWITGTDDHRPQNKLVISTATIHTYGKIPAYFTICKLTMCTSYAKLSQS